ncbi:aldolase [Sphingomonas oleivorans]|uniref:Aldolase n=1 Tax=Sphingomonas oleivorans TaxID=1735121 RepID=A0A2T5FWI8_9SPHN|nr:HPr kinase/phosphatase C-terminal domain-containing protein [Sphingomonas oleivorans]PTQ10147.1 aldolase [Sphingomonas oleivorans]
MSLSQPPELLHASCVAIHGRGVLLQGPSGAGKSDLALRLIDRGARLVSDDYTLLHQEDGRLVATAPDNIKDRIEVRGLGILAMAAAGPAAVALLVALDRTVARMPPEPCETRNIAGIDLPVIALAAFEASAPLKVELALDLFGLKDDSDA